VRKEANAIGEELRLGAADGGAAQLLGVPGKV